MTIDKIAINDAPEITGDCALGIDIGTTSVCAVVTNGDTSASFSVPNGCDLPSDGVERLQDADAIVSAVKTLADALIGRYGTIRRIGIDNQMHGILYTDGAGRAISPLVTWQDGRGDLPLEGESACERILRLTGQRIYTGYGLATLYHDHLTGRIPQNAASICTVGDYAAMRLCGLNAPHVHPTNAASMGLFDVRHSQFDEEAVNALGLGSALLPEISEKVTTVGDYRSIPVNVAVGDNQAAYFGAMPEGGVLCNIGTGSQICAAVDEYRECKSVECRPFFAGRYLMSGSALCGGRAYALLERFFREYVGDGSSQYERMNELALIGYDEGRHPEVSTRFCGTRENPALRGSITGIGEDDLTPQGLICGIMYGMADELFGYFGQMGLPTPKCIVLSGNAPRRNPVLCRIVADVFGADAILSDVTEEAAFGAARLALKGEQ